MDEYFGRPWLDVLFKVTTASIVHLPNRVRPIVRSEVPGYPTGFV